MGRSFQSKNYHKEEGQYMTFLSIINKTRKLLILNLFKKS